MKFIDFPDKKLVWIIAKYFTSKGACATILYRISNSLYKRKHYWMAHFIHNYSLRVTGADINEGADIGSGFDIRHPVGIVIGGGSYHGE